MGNVCVQGGGQCVHWLQDHTNHPDQGYTPSNTLTYDTFYNNTGWNWG
jgi:hypothetical protein